MWALPGRPAVKDVPRAGFSCRSHSDGHNVRYQAVVKGTGRGARDHVQTLVRQSEVTATRIDFGYVQPRS